MSKRKRHPILAAVDNAPSQASVARHLGVTVQSFNEWVQRARETGSVSVPARHAVKLAALAGVRPHDVRPDVFLERWAVKRSRIDASGALR